MNDPADTVPPVQLSPVGAARRRDMLGALVADQARVQRGRRTQRRTVSALGLALAACAVAYLGRSTPAPSPSAEAPLRVADAADGAATTTRTYVTFVTVVTDPTVLERAAAASSHSAEFLDDAGLVAALGEIGRPAGVMRVGAEVRLTANVVDEG